MTPAPEPQADVARRLDALLARLCDEVGASRTTIRVDSPAWGIDVDDVIAEAHADGVRSLRGERSIDQRALATVRFLEERRAPLVQSEFRTTEHPPPQALIDVYGVQAQMLAPLVHGGDLVGWLSVHEVGRERDWAPGEVAALEAAAGEALAILTAGEAFAEAR